ncbi:hypothetical protein Tco_0705152 [Tanacetum coccineum]|uniref:Uncharacterized protein n=1 Tax=Tanacetum coccineum TaxID=301880 RepID=A0ABQ4Y3X9_9ASTR
MSTLSNSQMHNSIMADGFNERHETPEDGDRPRVPGFTKKETYANTSLENRKLINVEAEAVHMILNGILDDIYSTMDDCPNAKEMDGESIESYYTRFYRMTNEMVRNKLKVDNMQEVLHAIDDNSRPTYDVKPLEKVHINDDYNVFATKRQHSEQPESISNTYVVETVDSNIIPDSTDMCDNEKKDEQNAEEPGDEHVLLVSLIANLKLDIDENKNIHKQLKKANTSLTQELDKYMFDLKYCKIELERNKTFQTNQKDKKIVELKCKEALDLMASNNHKNAESLKTEAYRTFSVTKENAKLNDLANMFAPESEETIRLAEKSRSKLVTLVKPYDYQKLNNLHDLLVPQQQKSQLSKGANSLQAEEQDIPPPTITAMKIPIIRKGEYDIWSMRMRQYICHTDHNLWDVIVNGDLEEEPAPTTGETSAPPAPKTAKQLAARRNQERVKSILLLAIPDEYLLKFHNVADAKSLWEAIKSSIV